MSKRILLIEWYFFYNESMLIRPSYNIDLTLKNTYKLQFKQASYFETLDFIDKSNDTYIPVWVVEFIEKASWKPLKIVDKKVLYDNLPHYMDIIYNTYFEGCFDKEHTGDTRRTPRASFVVLCCKELWLKPNEVLHEYTLSQLVELMEWAIRNANEQTDEGKRKNRQKELEYKAKTRSEEDKQKDNDFFNS